MPELNHRFHTGRMNKDLDERLVANGEYRDALNVEVATSEGSNVGALQSIMGNINLSSIKPFTNPVTNLQEGEFDLYCVGSIVDEKEDKIYWLISGIWEQLPPRTPKGIDIIAEYSYVTKEVLPVVVDIFDLSQSPSNESGRVLNFDKGILITGIPQTAPLLEMKNTTRLDVSGNDVDGEIFTTIESGSLSLFTDPTTGALSEIPFSLNFSSVPDFQIGDLLDITANGREFVVEIVSAGLGVVPTGWNCMVTIGF